MRWSGRHYNPAILATSRPFPGFSNVYELGDPLQDRPFRGDIESLVDPFIITRGEIQPDKPVIVRWAMGSKKPGHIIHTTGVVPLIMHDRVVELLNNKGFNGWDMYDVTVLGKDGKRIAGYHGLAVHGRCGPIDDSKSIQVPKRYPAGHRFFSSGARLRGSMGSQHTSKPFPGFSRVYVLSESGGSRAFRGDIDIDLDVFALTRGELRLEKPLVVPWAMGSLTPTDVIRTTAVAPFILHDRVIRLLTDNGFTGWNTYKVHVLGKKGEYMPNYHGLAVDGRCGPIDNSKSIQVPKQHPAGIFPVWKGLYFDPESWDGSDLFMPTGKEGWIFVVDDVRRAFVRAKVKNVVYTALAEVERMTL